MGKYVRLYILRKRMKEAFRKISKALDREIEKVKIKRTPESLQKLEGILIEEADYIKEIENTLSRLREQIISGAWYLIMEYSIYIYNKYRTDFLRIYKENPEISIYEFVEEKVKIEGINLEGIPASYESIQGYSSSAQEELLLTTIEQFQRLKADYELQV